MSTKESGSSQLYKALSVAVVASIIGVGTYLVTPNVAYADVVSIDDPVFGFGSITRDTETGLEWLDLTKSVGRSFDDVSTQFGVGEDFEGFRHATLAEIEGLWISAGIDIGTGFTTANFVPISDLQALIGITRITADGPISQGTTADIAPGFAPLARWVARLHIITGVSGFADPRGMIARDTEASPKVGHWLVRTPVPVINVAVDIKPGSDPNAVNPAARGLIPVAVLTTDSFDALTVSVSAVQFGPDGASIAHRSGHLQDVDSDGDLDLVLHFRTQESGIQCGDTEAALTGQTFAGVPIQGSDSIVTVGCI